MSYTTQFVLDNPLHQTFPSQYVEHPHSLPHTASTTTTTTTTHCDVDSATSQPYDYFSILATLQRHGSAPALSVHVPSSTFTSQQASAASSATLTASTPLSAPALSLRHDSAASGFAPDWMYAVQNGHSMGGSVQNAHQEQRQGLKRQRSHQRTPSTSTIGSTGPSSPHNQNTSYPHIANTDLSPDSPAALADPAQGFSKHLPQYAQQQAYNGFVYPQVQSAHMAMKLFATDHHNADDLPPEFTHSAHSMSSNGYNSPATPRSASDHEAKDDSNRMQSNGDSARSKPAFGQNGNAFYRTAFQNSNPASFYRTESAAFQDELYNPANFSPAGATPPKSTKQYLSPHRNLINERINTANNARSSSPTSAMSRERSPFRQGSPLAPLDGWNSPRAVAHTASSMRQKQKEQAEQAEYARNQPSLQREPTKTISPKEALLDYNGADEPSLFQDTVPAGYKQHFGGAEMYSNDMFSQSGAAFGDLAMPSQQSITNFRATTSDGFGGNQFNFSPHGIQGQGMTHNNPFSSEQYQAAHLNSYHATAMDEPAPQFPAHLTSMDSSMSENAAQFISSQDSTSHPAPKRPSDTRANTGTYTCTYHGCAQRFDSHTNLQKHKREFHRSQAAQHRSDTSTENTASESPRSNDSPAPSSTSGMTSAAILERNSQAGPHKCTRINPSTNKPCNTIFSRPYDLTRHEDTIHNNRKQKVRCPMCREEKTFSRNDALTRHMRVVHPEVEAFGKRGRRAD